jgi:hypothetical protein
MNLKSTLTMGKTKKSSPSSCPRSRFILLFRVLGFLVLFALVACQSFPRFTVETLPQYDALFQRTSGWTGGDGAYSAALGNNRLLWLFGDTLLGEVEDGRRVRVRLISNSAAIQTGKDLRGASVDFVYRTLPMDHPAAFVAPEDGLGWFWPYHAVRTPDGLYLFYLQLERTDTLPTFGFKLVASWLGHVGNPDEHPDRWVISQRRIPWGNEQRLFGSSVLTRGDHCYIYGIVEERVGGIARKHMILARAPTERLGDFSAWRFFADGEWVAEVECAGRICENVASEFSVSFQPALRQYVLAYSEGGLSENIVIRLSPTPHGPWTSPKRVYQCPEAQRDPRLFCYAAKGHPEMSMIREELIITYVVNSRNFDLLQSDADLYRPRFLRIRFAGTGQN